MMRRSLAGMFGAAAVAAVVTTGFVHAQAQDGAGAPPAPHERRGPGGPVAPVAQAVSDAAASAARWRCCGNSI